MSGHRIRGGAACRVCADSPPRRGGGGHHRAGGAGAVHRRNGLQPAHGLDQPRARHATGAAPQDRAARGLGRVPACLGGHRPQCVSRQAGVQSAKARWSGGARLHRPARPAAAHAAHRSHRHQCAHARAAAGAGHPQRGASLAGAARATSRGVGRHGGRGVLRPAARASVWCAGRQSAAFARPFACAAAGDAQRRGRAGRARPPHAESRDAPAPRAPAGRRHDGDAQAHPSARRASASRARRPLRADGRHPRPAAHPARVVARHGSCGLGADEGGHAAARSAPARADQRQPV